MVLTYLFLLLPVQQARVPAASSATITEERAAKSHAQMLEALREVASGTATSNRFLGEASAERARSKVAALEPETRPYQRWMALRMLGYHELRLGNAEASVEAHGAACALLDEIRDKMPPEAQIAARRDFAVAYLRLGETQNCVARHTSKSCILPIQDEGVHVEQEASRSAIRILEELLQDAPDDLSARWLLNVGYMTIGGYPDDVPEPWRIPPEVFESDAEFPRFKDVAPEHGLNTNSMCGGLIVDDFDGDQRLDIVVADWSPASQLRYFKGLGQGEFVERTDEAGFKGMPGGLNMMQADYDNDGLVDILILRGAWLRERGKHPNSLLKNIGDGRFLDVTFAAGLGDEHHPTQAAGWADYDNDGDLDLYIGNEMLNDNGASCQLFRNDGDGTFTEVARAAGVANDRFAKGVTWGDYDGDRFPDLYVSNQNDLNRLFHNKGDGTFRDVAGKLGVVQPSASFPTWFWDYDNDGALDLLVLTYTPELRPVVASYLDLPHSAELTRLYRGDGGESFTKVGRKMGLKLTNPTMGCNFGDLDNDGYLDFYLGTGYPAYDGLVPNLMYRNCAGETFADVTTTAGFGHVQKGHAVAFADLDEDGDQDVFIELGGAFPGDAFGNAFFENPGFGNHWIVVEVVGTRSNRSGIGARIRCQIDDAGTQRSVYRHVNSGGSFGANPLRQSVGLGKAKKIDMLEIYWPTSDTTQRFVDVAVDQRIVVVEGQDSFEIRD